MHDPKRLKIDGRTVSETETMTVRSQQEGMFFDVDALKAPSPAMNLVPAAALREARENGRRMAGPGCTFQPPSCENMKAQRIPTLSGITYRLVAVDEEPGLVLFRLDFGPGSLFGPDNRWLHAWEAFKIHGGEIHAAEAFMRGMPANTPSGW